MTRKRKANRGLGLLTGLAAIGLAMTALSPRATAADPLRALIVDGRNNHDWVATTAILKADLEQSGRFRVEVVSAPPTGAPDTAWEGFTPKFALFDVVVLNYNGELWPQSIRKALEAYVWGGGGLVVIHAANNPFPDWPAYNDMIGLGWRGADFGARITVDDSNRVVRTPKGEGPGAGHGIQHAYKVDIRDPDHPITKGMPRAWPHAPDELYHGQRGPAKNMTILATAYSDKATGGTGANEPLVWVVSHGKGKVFVNLLGHVARGHADGAQGADFRSLVQRGTEWAATGVVTIPVPKDFPTAGK